MEPKKRKRSKTDGPPFCCADTPSEPLTPQRSRCSGGMVIDGIDKEAPWRTFDGTPAKTSRTSLGSKTGFKERITPRVEKRVHTIVVPEEKPRRPRGPPCGSSNKWKWALVALATALVVGFAIRKYVAK